MIPSELEPLPLSEGPTAFLAAYDRWATPVARATGEALWRFSLSGRADDQRLLQQLEELHSDTHADPATYEALVAWADRPELEPLQRRQLELLVRQYRDGQVNHELRHDLIHEALEIEELHSTFRAPLDGVPTSSNELDRVLLHEPDGDRRRAAWEATREVGRRAAGGVRSLARLRNEQARALGFDDYYALALDDQELTVEGLDALLEPLAAGTDAPWEGQKERLDSEVGALRGKVPQALQPWDYSDRFLQTVPRSDPARSIDPWFGITRIHRHARNFYGGLGLPIDALWEASDMLPRAGKAPHAFCVGVDNPDDVRVLCNLDGTARWMETTLHEFGHALYNRGIDRRLPHLLRQPAHTFVTEGVAMFFGRLVRSPRWLVDVVGLPPERAEAGAGDLAEEQLVFARWALVVHGFERALYADPDADLDARWWSLVEQLQGLRRPDGWGGGDWAAKIHVACYPVYYFNYLLGELFASQLHAALARHLGQRPNELSLVGRREVGAFFDDLFRSGRSLSWQQTVHRHTGGPLSADAWLEAFAR